MEKTPEDIAYIKLKERLKEVWQQGQAKFGEKFIPEPDLIVGFNKYYSFLKGNEAENILAHPRFKEGFSFETLIPENETPKERDKRREKRAIAILGQMLDKVEADINLTDVAEVDYPALFRNKNYKNDLETLEKQLGTLRSDIVKKIRSPKEYRNQYTKDEIRGESPANESLLEFRERQVYFYKAKENQFLQEQVNKRTGEKPIYWFGEHEIKEQVLLHSLQPFAEGRQNFTYLMNAIDVVSFERKNPELRRPGGDIIGHSTLLRELQESLFREGVGLNILKQLNLEHYFNDRFYKVDSDSFSMQKSELNRIAVANAPKLKQPGNPRKLVDELLQDIYACAKFDRNPWVTKDIESRFTKPATDRTQEEKTKKQKNDGMDVMVAGMVVSAIGGTLAASAQHDRQLQVIRPGEKAEDFEAREKKVKRNANRKLVFSTIVSVAATLMIVDGIFYQGKHTRDIWNRLRGKGGSGGPSIS